MNSHTDSQDFTLVDNKVVNSSFTEKGNSTRENSACRTRCRRRRLHDDNNLHTLQEEKEKKGGKKEG